MYYICIYIYIYVYVYIYMYVYIYIYMKINVIFCVLCEMFDAKQVSRNGSEDSLPSHVL